MNFEKKPPTPLDRMSQELLSQKPLHFACYAGDSEIVDILLSRPPCNNNNEEAGVHSLKAMISEEDTIKGWTPAHWAAYYGQLNCLMKLHVYPDIGFDTPTQKLHTSPLHLSAQSGAILCLKWLLQCGASLNRQDFMGETPLHKAAKAGNADSATMLISHGASLDLRNHRGCRPIDLADPTLALYLKRSSGRLGISLPISDLSLSVPFPSSLPPPHLPHPDHAKYNKFPYVSDHYVDRTLFVPDDSENLGILMNGESIGTVQGLNHSDADITEGFSTSSSQSCSDMETLPIKCRAKRPIGAFEGNSMWEEDSGDIGTTSPKRRCFGFGMEDIPSEYSDACNNNTISSCDTSLAKGFNDSSSVHSSMFLVETSQSSPPLAQSSSMEHEETLSAEQGYDSSMMCAMQDLMY